MFKSLLICLLLIQILNAKEKYLKKVSLQLSWFNRFQFAGYYVAKEIVNGNVDFAIGRETLIIEKAKNDDIISLYALFQNSPLVLLSLKKSNIDTINDFSNKTIMTTIDDAEVSIKAMISSHTHNINDLINKKTDVISAYLSKSPYELEN